MVAHDDPAGDWANGDVALDDVALDEAAFQEWRRRRVEHGARVDVLDLYELVAAARGVPAHSLSLLERQALADRALAVIWPGFERVGRRRPSGPVVLAEPDPVWAVRFQAWRRAICGALGDRAVRVEHIGSTAVPALAAKPIVDALVSLRALDDEDAYVPALEEVGLELYSRDDEHRFFVNAEPDLVDFHLHVCEVGGPFERDHVLFRDYLRAHDDERDRYAAMKRDVAERWPEDRQAYTYAKSELILELLGRAEAWAEATGWALPDPDG